MSTRTRFEKEAKGYLEMGYINAIFRKYKRETEGGRTFAVSTSRLWDNVPLSTRKVDSVACFKHNMWSKFFRDQQLLHHFHI